MSVITDQLETSIFWKDETCLPLFDTVEFKEVNPEEVSIVNVHGNTPVLVRKMDILTVVDNTWKSKPVELQFSAILIKRNDSFLWRCNIQIIKGSYGECENTISDLVTSIFEYKLKENYYAPCEFYKTSKSMYSKIHKRAMSPVEALAADSREGVKV